MIGLAAITPPKETITRIVALGLLIGFIGILVLLSPKLLIPLKLTGAFWPSIISLILMSFFWASGSIYARKHASRIPLLMSVGIQNAFAGLLLMPVCYLTIQPFHVEPSTSSIIALLYLIVFGTMISIPCYQYVLKHLPVSLASTFAYVTPVLTVLFGWVFLGEELAMTTVIGMGIILLGVGLVQQQTLRKAKSGSVLSLAGTPSSGMTKPPVIKAS